MICIWKQQKAAYFLPTKFLKMCSNTIIFICVKYNNFLMIVNNFEVLEVRLTKIDGKNNVANFKVICSDDSNPTYLEVKQIERGMEWVAGELIKKLKVAKKKNDPEQTGPLSNLSIVNVLNDEEVIESVYKGMIRVDNKVTNLKRIRVASEYMKLFDQVNTMQETLYRKRNFGED